MMPSGRSAIRAENASKIPGNLAESGDRGKSLHFAGLGRQTGAALVGRGHGQEVGDGDPLGRPAELVAAVAHVPAGDAVGNAEKIPRLCPRDRAGRMSSHGSEGSSV